MTTPRKRVLAIRLTPVDRKDPSAILKAVKVALSRANISLRVGEKEPDRAETPVESYGLEALETEALKLAKLHLQKMNAQLEKEIADLKVQASPSTSAFMRSAGIALNGLWMFLGLFVPSGFKVTVEQGWRGS